LIDQAVILAAGQGARLCGESDAPKPLTRVCGLTLFKRTLLSLQAEGVKRAVVVVGYRADEIRRAAEGDPDLRLEISFVENPDWRLGNGISVLAAKGEVQGEFFLTMADHVFERGILRALRAGGIPAGGVSLAVDRKLAEVFDLEDATKVETSGDRIVRIGKQLTLYDAIDTGLFACSSGLFESLDRIRALRKDASLSEGVGLLAQEGRARAVEIGDATWQDVDTPATLREAERRLLRTLRKPADGLVARHLNRHISLAITRRLARTRVRPNHVTLFTFAVGCAAAWLAAGGEAVTAALGGFLYQCKSILDGVDGELARLKFQGSRLGEWLDTVGDDLSNILFYAGVAVGAERATGDSLYLYLGGAAILLALFCSGLMYRWIWTRERSGDLLAFRWFFEREGTEAPGILAKLKYLAKQDFFVFFFFLLGLFGALHLSLYFVCGVGVVLVCLLAVQYAMSPRAPRPDVVRLERLREREP
jgi:CDP-L-myo-inositol myo-inositolphosphotransferase